MRRPRLAKLTRPRLHRAIPREGLHRRLDQLAALGSVWVCGPPGAGKTSAVASWLDNRQLGGVWYHLDPDDQDASTLFYYLRCSLGAARHHKRTLPLFTPEYSHDLAGFARRFARDFFSRLSEGGVLVFDNYHEVSTSTDVGVVLEQFIAEVPASVSLILISRSAPPPMLASLLITDRLSVIGGDALRFTLEESRHLAAAHRVVDKETVRRLHDEVEGWAAGLTLTLKSGGGSARSSRSSFPRETLFEYFASNAFDQLPSEARRMLMSTAVLPTVTPAAAIALGNVSTSDELLSRLHRAHLFTDLIDSGARRYRYHDLFREFLLRRFDTDVDPVDRLRIRTTAAALLVESGELERAFALFCEAESWDHALALMLAHAQTLLGQGRWRILSDWAELLPKDRRSRAPWLGFWLGCAQMQTDLGAGRRTIIEAYSQFHQHGDAVGEVMASAAIIQAVFYEYDNFTRMDEWIDRLVHHLEGGTQLPSHAAELHVWSAFLIACCYRRPTHPLIRRSVERVDYLLLQPLEVNQRVAAAGALLTYCTLAADFDRANPLIERITPLLAAVELTALNAAYWWLFVGYYYHVAAKRKPCLAAFDRSDEIATAHGLIQTAFLSVTFRGYAHCAWGETQAAAAVLARLVPLIDHARSVDVNQFHLVNASFGIAAMEPDAGARHAELAVEAAARIGSPFFMVASRSIGAFCVAAAGDVDRARTWIEAVWADTENGVLQVYRPLLIFGLAYCCFLHGERKESLRQLDIALGLAQRHSGACFFRWAQAIKNTLLVEALGGATQSEYAIRLIRQFRVPPPEVPIPNWPWEIEIETLGRFLVKRDGQPLTFQHKTPRKPLALLKAVIAHGGNNVPESTLVDTLWPADDGDSAHEALTAALFRLRKILENPDAVRLENGCVSLDQRLVRVDALAFLQQTAGESTRYPIAQSCALYRGEFLPEEQDAGWTSRMRERLRERFVSCIATLARNESTTGCWDVAQRVFRKGIEVDDRAEALWHGLMQCQLDAGHYQAGIETYKRLEALFASEQRGSLSPATTSLYLQLLDANRAAYRRAGNSVSHR